MIRHEVGSASRLAQRKPQPRQLMSQFLSRSIN